MKTAITAILLGLALCVSAMANEYHFTIKVVGRGESISPTEAVGEAVSDASWRLLDKCSKEVLVSKAYPYGLLEGTITEIQHHTVSNSIGGSIQWVPNTWLILPPKSLFGGDDHYVNQPTIVGGWTIATDEASAVCTMPE